MAQTLTSTRPLRKANARTVASSRSVNTLAERFGQAIHSAPPGVVSRCRTGHRARSWALLEQKQMMTSYGPWLSRRETTTPSGSPSRRKPEGAPSRRTREPAVMPSLRTSGVPEYPTTNSWSHMPDTRDVSRLLLRYIATRRGPGAAPPEPVSATERAAMTTWTIDEPRQQTLDQTVDSLRVWLAHGRLRVVAAEGPVRLDVRKVGRRGLDVKLEDGVLSIRHPVRDRRWVPFWWLVTGRRNYYADIIIAVPPTVAAALTLINGSALASGLRRGVTMDVTSGSITLMGVGGRVRAKTVSGGIQAVGVGGDLSMQTVSGEITLA